MNFSRLSILVGAVTATAFSIAAFPSSAHALDFTFTGNLDNRNQVLLFDFSIAQTQSVTVFSSSVREGGFDPILAVWDSAGNLIIQQDDGGQTSGVSNGVSYNLNPLDTYFTQVLNAGSYKASLTAFPNFANGTNLSQGFQYDSLEIQNFSSPSEAFWRFHIVNADESSYTVINSAAVPFDIPGGATIPAVGGLLALGLMRKARKSLASNTRFSKPISEMVS
ncbi:DVUA0089 family protein [Nostoc sp.]|uniref:DVUA0089 family protein n=1 Tax=Nostoc sp. TaxID=1180 RepID=UPI003592F8B8